MALTSVQQGVIGEMEFAKVLMMTSNGELEVVLPMSDDERRDMEVHRRRWFTGGLAWQAKCSIRLHLDHHRRVLAFTFSVPKKSLYSHPRFWYFFAHLLSKEMRFADPVFLIPSPVVHQHASPKLHGNEWTFHFRASLEPEAHDVWLPYRVAPARVGSHVLGIIRQMSRTATAPVTQGLTDTAGLLWVGPRG